jgi:hypothetical protein
MRLDGVANTDTVEFTLAPVMTNEFYEILVRTNGPEGHWMTMAGYNAGNSQTLSATCSLSGIPGLNLQTLKNWTFVGGRWNDSLGDELPSLYKELALRIDPFASADPYAILMGDGWSTIQKLQNNMDPLRCYSPPAPRLSAQFYGGTNNSRYGRAVLTWQAAWGAAPEYFLLERANRTLRPRTNDARPMTPAPKGFQRMPPTNRPSGSRAMYGRPGWQREDPVVTGPFQLVARIPSQPGVNEYRYVDPNVDTLFQPSYRIQTHYSPPLHAYLDRVDAAGIRRTILPAAAQQTTNGYTLSVPHPIPYAWYLLLVRDKSDPQWRASGYFASGTNRDPVTLRVDKKGMMSDGQSPISMPGARFLPDVVEPEFTAGWGEDSDGDGLPDVYEVLVTRTDPDNADTGGTGVLDGYRETAGDGWNNLEKFRRRVDPLKPASPPATVELNRPTGSEIIQALTPTTGLACEAQIEIRPNGSSGFQPIEKVPWMFSRISDYRQPNVPRDFDIRVSWRFTEQNLPQFRGPRYSEVPAAYEVIESLRERAGAQTAERFKATLASTPPLARKDATNLLAAIERAYRQGEIDKGVAMVEMVTVQDNQSQDFYGKVIDQHGQPVVGAEVKVAVNLAVGRGASQETQTDAAGQFQFVGLRGESLNIVPEKKGYQIEGHGLGIKGHNGPETSPTNRAVYTMWKLVGPEPIVHNHKSHQIKPDGRLYTIDLLANTAVEGTNDAGDLQVELLRPPSVKPREAFDWSFSMTAVGGGLIEVSNDDYLNEAPERGYQPQYKLDMSLASPKRRGWNGEETFYLKSRDGKAYGHFHIRIDPAYRDGSLLEIDSYINPSGSRNLEFDPSKQIQYAPKAQPAAPPPASAPAAPKAPKPNSTEQR